MEIVLYYESTNNDDNNHNNKRNNNKITSYSLQIEKVIQSKPNLEHKVELLVYTPDM